MFSFIDNPRIPKSTNALESFFGHLKDNKNFIKWYLFFRENINKSSAK